MGYDKMRPTLKSLESKLENSLLRVDTQMAELSTQIGRINSDLRCDLQFNVYDRLDTLSLKIDTHRKETEEKFEEVNDKFEEVYERLDELNARLDEHRKETAEKFALVDARFDRLEARFDKFEAEFYPKIGEVIRDALCAVGFTYDPKLANFEQRISSLEWSRKCSRSALYLSSSKFELNR